MVPFGHKKEATDVPDENMGTDYKKEGLPEDALQTERAKKELALLRKELDDTAATLDSTLSRLENLRSEYHFKSSEINSLNEELQRKRTELRSITAEYNAIKTDFDRLRSVLPSTGSAYDPEVESTKQQIESARSELSELNYERQDARKSLDDLRTAVSLAKSELESLRSETETAGKETAKVRKELEFIQKELGSVNQLDRTNKIAQATAGLVSSLNLRYEELKKELGVMQAALSRAREENRQLKEDREKLPWLDQNLLDAKSVLESLIAQQQTKKKEFEETKKELVFIQKELASLFSSKYSVAKSDIPEGLDSTFGEIRKDLELVRTELAKLRQIFEEKKSTVGRTQVKDEKAQTTVHSQMLHEYHTSDKARFEVLLQPVGQVPVDIMQVLQKTLGQQFRDMNFVLSTRPLELPIHFLDASRDQFRSPQIIRWIEENCKQYGCHKILGICDANAYSGRLNFVFGEAQLDGMVGVVYLKMLKSELEEGASEDLFFQRTLKEAVHELGHTFGLGHCVQRSCVMYFSNSIAETDYKKSIMCDLCTKKLLRY